METKKAIPAILGLALICFFLPFVTVSCQGQKLMTFSGIQLVTGTTIQEPQMFGPPSVLGRLLRLGGSFVQVRGNDGRIRREFCAPYVVSVLPPVEDPFSVLAVVGAGVNLPAQPSKAAQVIGKLSYNLVQPAPWPWLEKDKSGQEWAKVVVNSEVTGYVESQYVYSPVGWRACFRQDPSGHWVMASLVSGD